MKKISLKKFPQACWLAQDENGCNFWNNEIFCKEKKECINIDKECNDCHYTCKTCDPEEKNSCVSCNDKKNRVLNELDKTCECDEGYTESNFKCRKPCHYTCETCDEDDVNKCTTCDDSKNRSLEKNECICKEDYIEDEKIC